MSPIRPGSPPVAVRISFSGIYKWVIGVLVLLHAYRDSIAALWHYCKIGHIQIHPISYDMTLLWPIWCNKTPLWCAYAIELRLLNCEYMCASQKSKSLKPPGPPLRCESTQCPLYFAQQLWPHMGSSRLVSLVLGFQSEAHWSRRDLWVQPEDNNVSSGKRKQ